MVQKSGVWVDRTQEGRTYSNPMKIQKSMFTHFRSTLCLTSTDIPSAGRRTVSLVLRVGSHLRQF